MSAPVWYCCPRCGTPDPEVTYTGHAVCDHCRWRGRDLLERSTDDPAPESISLHWLNGCHPQPQLFDAVMDDEARLPWDVETLADLSERIGDTAGTMLAEMAETAWGVVVEQWDTPNDYAALRHVAEQVSAEAMSRQVLERQAVAS